MSKSNQPPNGGDKGKTAPSKSHRDNGKYNQVRVDSQPAKKTQGAPPPEKPAKAKRTSLPSTDQ